MSGEQTKPSRIPAAEAIASILRRRGIKRAFGLPGTQNLGVFDMLRRAGIPLVTTATETGAAFMSIGYERASGSIPLLVTIPGPGALFAMPGVAEAREDSVRLIWIVASHSDGKRRFGLHSLDIEAVAAPAVKQVFKATTAGDLPAVFERAISVSDSGEPGPVLIMIDDRHLEEQVEEAATPRISSVTPVSPLIEELAARLAGAERPLFFLGRGAEQSRKTWLELASKSGAAITTTLSGRGVVPEWNERLIYHDFSSGTGPGIQELFDRSDLVVACGVKFSHNGAGGFSLKIGRDKLVHIDRSPATLGGDYPASLEIESDAAVAGESLLVAVQSKKSGWEQAELDSIRARVEHENAALESTEPWVRTGIKSIHWRKFYRSFFNRPLDWIVTTDSGLHQFLVRRTAAVGRPGGLITPADFQSMGFSIPAAIGAALAATDGGPQADGYAGSSDLRAEVGPRRAVAVVGDGGLLFSLGELSVAKREGLNLVVVVINDGSYGLIRRQQIQRYGVAGGLSVTTPELPALASSLSARYVRYRDVAGITLESAAGDRGLTIVEVETIEPRSIDRMRLKVLTRETVRRLLGPNLIARLKGRN